MRHPATYTIEVRGGLPAGLVAQLDGFTQASGTDGGTTVLTGRLADSSALYGLLARLESLGVALISVRQVPPDEEG